jgi:hypothetical protein
MPVGTNKPLEYAEEEYPLPGGNPEPLEYGNAEPPE